MNLHDVACGVFGAWSIVCQSSTVALLVLLHNAKTFSCKERFSRLWGQREKNKKEKSEEGACSSSSNVDEELVRSFCLFCVIATLSLTYEGY